MPEAHVGVQRPIRMVDVLLTSRGVAQHVVQHAVPGLWPTLISEMVRLVNDHNVSEACGTLKGLTLRLRIDICVRHQL